MDKDIAMYNEQDEVIEDTELDPMVGDMDLANITEMVNSYGVEVLTPEEEELYTLNNPEQQQDPKHYDNLAEGIEPRVLSKLAQQIETWFDEDESSRDDWRRREAKGVSALGVSERTIGGADFEGASRVVHPLLIEAVTQFHSRALAEMWPADGPVKTKVLGEPTPELNDQAKRVMDYMNYLYLNKMPGAFDEEDKLLFRLPLSGSCFKKLYYCPIAKTFLTRLIEPSDFVVPYSAIDLRTAPRFTHRFYEQLNDIKKKQVAKYYRPGAKITITAQTPDYLSNPMKDVIDNTEGLEDNSTDIQPHTMYEMYADLDLEGYEDPDGIARPYVVTIDKDEQTVLRIQRNWKPDDEDMTKKICIAHYKYNPGFGFYGFGLYHLIGGLSAAATGALRSLLDAASFSNLQGGYRTRDARIPGDSKPIRPGEWRELNSSADDLKKAFFPLPYKEPSKTLFELMGYLDERGQRFASTTENMVGEANNSAPVGTTLALIEQGSKVFSAIHKRLHIAHAEEFRILHDLNYEYLPDGQYPYHIGDTSVNVMAQDFDGRVDISPVSDPEIISNTQRITQAQAVLDLADKYPDIVNRRIAVTKMLEAVRIPNIEELLLPESQEPTPEEKLAQSQALKLEAEINKLEAETVAKNIESTFSAVQSAGSLAMQPDLIPTADSLLQSAGFEDHNEYPVAQVPNQVDMTDGNTPPQIEQQPLPPGVDMNTSPNSPPVMDSPMDGMNTGIETQTVEDN